MNREEIDHIIYDYLYRYNRIVHQKDENIQEWYNASDSKNTIEYIVKKDDTLITRRVHMLELIAVSNI